MSLRGSLISDLVCENPRRASVFEEHDIDYCRAGQRSLANLCRELGLNVDQVEGQLLSCDRDPLERIEWVLGERNLLMLADYMKYSCHKQMKAKLMRIAGLVEKVAPVYSGCNPELMLVRHEYAQLHQHLLEHMESEEEILESFVRASEGEAPMGDSTVFEPAKQDHEYLRAVFTQIRELTNEYTAPIYACGGYRVLLSELRQLEQDVNRCGDLEDGVLFQRVIHLATDPERAPCGK